MSNIITIANEMLTELEQNYQEVILIDAPEQSFEGHKIRLAVNKNPEWYSRYYFSRHATPQKKEFMKALRDIANGFFRDLTYYNEIIELAFQRLNNYSKA